MNDPEPQDRHITIYTGRHPEEVIRWANHHEPRKILCIPEIHNGHPEHIKEIISHTRCLCELGNSFITFSEIAILTAAQMMRKREIQDLVCIYLDEDNREHRILFDVNGDLVGPWPEEQESSLFDADFYLRYFD